MRKWERTIDFASNLLPDSIGMFDRRERGAFKALLRTSLVVLMALGGLSCLAQQLYVTQPGDTLFGIALRHGTTVDALAAANGLSFPYTIYAGTQILISQTGPSAKRTYLVQPGDNLFRIALRMGTTPEALAAVNGIRSPYTVHAGTRLILANAQDLAQQYYIVRPGDSLFSIAKRKGITAEALAAANGIKSPYNIHVGNWLNVPAPWCPEDEEMTPATPAAPEEEPVPVSVVRLPKLPDDPLSPSPSPNPQPVKTHKPEQKPKQCVYIQRYAGTRKLRFDAIDTLCIKICRAGGPPTLLCTERGYS